MDGVGDSVVGSGYERVVDGDGSEGKRKKDENSKTERT